MKAAAKLLVLGLATVVFTACAAPHAATPRQAPLRVGVSPTTPPYAFWREGRLVGLEVDFARDLAAALGRPLDLVGFEFNDLIPAVTSGRVDVIMAGLTITRAREVKVAFSDPYLRSGLLAMMRTEDVPSYKTVKSVLSTSDNVGVITGTTAERFVRENMPSARVLVYPTVQASIDELRQRRVTLVVHDAPVAIWYTAGDESDLAVLLHLLDDENLGWGLPRDNEALRSAVNEILARWRTDGTLDRVLQRWVPYWKRLEASDAPRR